LRLGEAEARMNFLEAGMEHHTGSETKKERR